MTGEYILSIFIAALLGGVIGLEREYREKAAGFRTHVLVGLGAALFMILSAHGFDSIIGTPGIRLDPSRIASQVVTGIGFIGAGTIIFQQHKVEGLTTAAGLWVTAAIGMAAGSGMYLLATAATVLVLICMEGMAFFHHKVFKHKNTEKEEDAEK
jgi:putative Mg2+ transporter-C (MgtC) family protein